MVFKCEIIYFNLSGGQLPVREFIDGLEVRAKNKILKTLGHIEEFGLISAIPHIKKLSGTPLWEIRLLGRDNVRVLFVSVLGNRIVL